MYSCNRLSIFLNKNKLIRNKQVSFKMSIPSDEMLEFLDNIYNSMNSHKSLLVAFPNFSKAFDVLNHTLLLQKFDWLFRHKKCHKLNQILKNTNNTLHIIVAFYPTYGSFQRFLFFIIFFLTYVNDLNISSFYLNFVILLTRLPSNFNFLTRHFYVITNLRKCRNE